MPTAAPPDVRRWVVIDASNQILGRLSARIASILRGKNKPTYAPHIDVGDFVVVVNAEKVRLTGRKLQQKRHFKHSGYPGGLKEVTYERLIQTHPERVIEYAVRGMLPNTPLGRKMFAKLKVYRGSEHPHTAQRPVPVAVDQDQAAAAAEPAQDSKPASKPKPETANRPSAASMERRLR